MHFSEAGKGADQRPTDHNKFSSGYDLIWGKKHYKEGSLEKQVLDDIIANYDKAVEEQLIKGPTCPKENPSA